MDERSTSRSRGADSAMLYIFAGLPGSGKTTLSLRLAAHFRAAYLRIDTVEQALRDLCGLRVEGEGYRMAYRVAADNLGLGISVVADSCNPISLTREEWQQVAIDAGARFRNIEVTCSDRSEHRRRVDQRKSSIATLRLPSWKDVEEREYHPWEVERIVVDTAGLSVEESLRVLLEALG